MSLLSRLACGIFHLHSSAVEILLERILLCPLYIDCTYLTLKVSLEGQFERSTFVNNNNGIIIVDKKLKEYFNTVGDVVLNWIKSEMLAKADKR